MTGHPNLMAPGAESQMNEKFPYNGKLLLERCVTYGNTPFRVS